MWNTSIESIGDLLKKFDDSDSTVKSFNKIFTNNKLKGYSEDTNVSIQGLEKNDLRIVQVGDDSLYLHLSPVISENRITPKYTKVCEAPTYKAGSNAVLSKEEMKLTPTEYFVLQMVRGIDPSLKFSAKELERDSGIGYKTISKALKKLKNKGFINLTKTKNYMKIMPKALH